VPSPFAILHRCNPFSTLNWLVFVQVAELGSLAKAAAAMDVPPSMASVRASDLKR
jgi:DNA-binding transcriptional LysR family regulator